MVQWFAFGVSLLALTVSVLAYWQRGKGDRRDLFLRLNDMMISLDSQRGRELLAEHAPTENWWAATPRDVREQINRALAQIDTMAIYVERGFIDADTVLSIWDFPVVRAWDRAKPYVDFRRKRENRANLWAAFERLAGLARPRVTLPPTEGHDPHGC